jgi:hypothetical protein
VDSSGARASISRPPSWTPRGEVADVGGVRGRHRAVGEDASQGLEAAVEEDPLLGKRAVGRSDEEDTDEKAEHAE